MTNIPEAVIDGMFSVLAQTVLLPPDDTDELTAPVASDLTMLMTGGTRRLMDPNLPGQGNGPLSAVASTSESAADATRSIVSSMALSCSDFVDIREVSSVESTTMSELSSRELHGPISLSSHCSIEALLGQVSLVLSFPGLTDSAS